ncbi:unnamed protein product [Diabrotica balteata]|uniref:Translation elongation factor EF1B beta/delta subunit guanine nucleotide exchange domain-containing protein n=1 Tax=Diabrotica balteata TaxID=107213 RepID=A0A9N9XI18_DIABA|nr:unnamed protein product [Diabrotica balteata]
MSFGALKTKKLLNLNRPSERLEAYAEKKSKKPELIAKSTIVLDVKPWDDEADIKELEKVTRTIEIDDLVWGTSKSCQ